MGFLDRNIRFLQDWFRSKTDGEKRQLALICTAVFVVVLTFSVIISIRGSGGEEGLDLQKRPKINVPIPAEEIFLPDEPDFLPGVLFERDRRTSWTEQDAAEYWEDPLRGGEEPWREKIETAVDEFLERIP
jgi:hypothetical protein